MPSYATELRGNIVTLILSNTGVCMVQLSCTDTHFNFYKVFKHFNDNFVRYFMFGLKYVETTIEYISVFFYCLTYLSSMVFL